jgi:hypothetical protein
MKEFLSLFLKKTLYLLSRLYSVLHGNIEPGYLENLWKRMPSRAAVVIAAQGWYLFIYYLFTLVRVVY